MITLETFTGRPMYVVQPEPFDNTQSISFSFENITNMQVDLNLSGREKLKLATYICNLFWKQNITLYKLNKHDETISIIWNERKYTENTQIKIGIDDGGGFLKICPFFNQVNELNQIHEPNKFKAFNYKNSVGHFKNKGNFSKIWFSDNSITDLKLANILVGLMSHSSVHPCTWCDTTKTQPHQVEKNQNIEQYNQKILELFQWRSKLQKKTCETFWQRHKLANNFSKWCGQKNNWYYPPPKLNLLLGTVNTIPNVIYWRNFQMLH